MNSLQRFLTLVASPLRAGPDAAEAIKAVVNVGGGGLIAVVTLMLWQFASPIGRPFGLTDTEVRAAWLALVGMSLLGVAGLRLQHRVDAYEAPMLRVSHAPAFDYWTWHEGNEVRSGRTVRVQVETLGKDVQNVRLNLLRFTPQGRNGAIFLRERHDTSQNYVQSRIQGYPVQVGAPAVFELCHYQSPVFQRRGDGKTFMAVMYAADPNIEPNAIEANRRYVFEVQAVGDSVRSEPVAFFAEVDSNGDLISGPATWPISASTVS